VPQPEPGGDVSPSARARSEPQPDRQISPFDRAFLTSQPDVRTVLLIRHGQQIWPSQRSGAESDWRDPPLSEIGQRQATALSAALRDESIDGVLCSHLRRSLDTARPLAKSLGIEPEVHYDLREVEIYRDIPPGSSIRDLVEESTMQDIVERFVRERRWDVFPYSESSTEVRNRVARLLERVLTLHARGNLAVVCHGGVINAWVGHLLGIDEDMFFRPGHASISRVLVGDGRLVLSTLNEMQHLKAVDRSLVTY
jgi:probable phosphoglycerate mutase